MSIRPTVPTESQKSSSAAGAATSFESARSGSKPEKFSFRKEWSACHATYMAEIQKAFPEKSLKNAIHFFLIFPVTTICIRKAIVHLWDVITHTAFKRQPSTKIDSISTPLEPSAPPAEEVE